MGATGTTIPAPALTALLSGMSESVMAEIETITGWRPLVGNGTDQARLYDFPGPRTATGRSVMQGGGQVLELDAPLLSLAGANPIVMIGADGGVIRTFTPEVDVLLQPYNGQFFTRLVFRRPAMGLDGRLRVTGQWGRFAVGAVPQDLVNAAREAAAARATAARMTAALGTGLTGWSEGDISEKFDSGSAQKALDAAENALRMVAARYMRMVVA